MRNFSPPIPRRFDTPSSRRADRSTHPAPGQLDRECNKTEDGKSGEKRQVRGGQSNNRRPPGEAAHRRADSQLHCDYDEQLAGLCQCNSDGMPSCVDGERRRSGPQGLRRFQCALSLRNCFQGSGQSRSESPQRALITMPSIPASPVRRTCSDVRRDASRPGRTTPRLQLPPLRPSAYGFTFIETNNVLGSPGETTPPATNSGYARSKTFLSPASTSARVNVHAPLTCARP